MNIQLLANIIFKQLIFIKSVQCKALFKLFLS